MPDSGQFDLHDLSRRGVPENLQAEEALLGALVANNKVHAEISEIIKAEDFSDPTNGRVYAEIDRQIRAGRLVDGVTLHALMAGTHVLEESGGSKYIAKIMAAMVGIINATEYAKVIADASVRRSLIDIGWRLYNTASRPSVECDPHSLSRQIISEIESVTTSPGIGNIVSLAAAMAAAELASDRARIGHKVGISTGFQTMDDRLGGLEPGLVYVLAGRPGMGKSAIGHQIALNVAERGVGVLELSLEMSALQLGRRTLATAAGVPIMAIKNGTQDQAAWDRIAWARGELANLPLSIDDTAGQTPSQIAAKCRQYRRKHGLGLILIDHLNLMRAEDQDARHGGTWATERASGAVLQIAKDENCPVILLCQLNRGVESREDKRPGLSDLRQAGAIEQDAYAVGFVYRPEYYLGGPPEQKPGELDGAIKARQDEWIREKGRLRGVSELIWAKVRDGEPGTDAMEFDGPTTTFSEPGAPPRYRSAPVETDFVEVL